MLKMYVDTSIAVALISQETQSDVAIAWISRQTQGALSSSTWLVAETHSALARKRRSGRMTDDEFTGASRQFVEAILPRFLIASIIDTHVHEAARICQYFQAGLRTPDALHLAVASSLQVPLVTLDKRFAAGAATLGYAVELIA